MIKELSFNSAGNLEMKEDLESSGVRNWQGR